MANAWGNVIGYTRIYSREDTVTRGKEDYPRTAERITPREECILQ